MTEEAKTPFQIVDGYEINTGSLVGANDFSHGHEAGQSFAAERIAATSPKPIRRDRKPSACCAP